MQLRDPLKVAEDYALLGRVAPSPLHELNRAVPYAVCYMHPADAKARGIKRHDQVILESPRGQVKIRVETGGRNRPPRGLVFVPWFDENVLINKVWGGPASGIDGGNQGGVGITDRPGGLKLQCEGHDVRYRNVWIKELDLTGANTDF